MPEPMIIGITGGTGSGKSFIAEKIHNSILNRSVIFKLDNYYLPLNKQPLDENGLYNFDTPQSLDFNCFETDLRKLIGGEKLKMKQYNFNFRDRIVHIEIEPQPVIILEGLFLFYRKSVFKMCDIKIFVDASLEIRIKRRLKRDVQERGYSRDNVLYKFENHVKPAHFKYIEPLKAKCDFVIQNDEVPKLDDIVKIIESKH